MKTFRKIIFWMHLVSAICAGVVIFIMSVTGALLAFERQVIEFSEHEARYVSAPAGAQKLPPQQILVDGNRCPGPDGLGFECLWQAVIRGDASVPAISAASILAKTTRDALMCDLDGRYPGFSLSGHKGYGTPSHVAALKALGPCPLHRRSFAPVRSGQGSYDPELLVFED